MVSIAILDTVEELLRAYDSGLHPRPELLAQLVQQVQGLLEAPVGADAACIVCNLKY
jgi:hypothetical protein